jgi:chemotaxis protein methyltransferase CheR
MNDALIQQFIQLISTHTGLHIREQDREALCKKIWARMKLLNLSVAENYYQLLQTGKHHNSPSQTLAYPSGNGNGFVGRQPLRGTGNGNAEGERGTRTLRANGESDREWRELALLLTTGESYFFRDQGQFTLLKTRMLPELIEHRKKAQYREGEAKPSLRIWSAGCSTGEEAYSLAVLVKELIPDYEQWNILILGTDINQESIEKAKLGIYDAWSFRMVDTELQRRYFYQWKTSWKVDERIRKMVTFRYGNLMKDHFPSLISYIHNVDLILCRNVFIYFDFKAISVVLEKFYNTLRPGGYLIAGHTELHGQNLDQLETKVFPQSVVYQKFTQINNLLINNT